MTIIWTIITILAIATGGQVDIWEDGTQSAAICQAPNAWGGAECVAFGLDQDGSIRVLPHN